MTADPRARGWTAGFLNTAPVVAPGDLSAETQAGLRLQALTQLIESGDDAGLCLVIDYAENRQEEVKRIAAQFP